MNYAVLTVGPPGAGKSTYCKEFVRHNPEFIYISRDEILIELFGSAWLDPYDGSSQYGTSVMWQKVEKALKRHRNSFLILDCFNTAASRWSMTGKLKDLGADRVDAWRFNTPADTCVKWFCQRSCKESKSKTIAKTYADNCLRMYNQYNAEPVELDQGFDFIWVINPLQLLLNF